MTLKEIDKEYIDAISSTVDTLKSVATSIQTDYDFDLDKTEISEAILNRLSTYYKTQNGIKIFLNKRYQTAGADFFVETVLFFIKLYLSKTGSNLEAHSERQIRRQRGAIRPDISIWNRDSVTAIIECKTQLGWNRQNWENDFNNRELKLKNEFPNAKAYLVVMTGLNWGGFGDSEKLGERYFCLLNETWPTDYHGLTQLMSPIELLIKEIVNND